MWSRVSIAVLVGMVVAAMPFSAIAKFVKVYRVPETGRTIVLSDEKVYAIKTSLGRRSDVRYDIKKDAFINARSKQEFIFKGGEWITDISSIEGVKPGGNVVAYITLKIRKGTTVFGYPFDCGDLDKNVSSNLLKTAVDGDRIMYQSGGTNYCFVSVFSVQNNLLQWHKTESFEVCRVLPIPDADTPFYYARMQDISTDVIFLGGRQLKSGDVIYFRDHGIDETYRMVEQYGFAKQVDFSANLLGGKSDLTSDVTKLSVLTPKKFYVILKSGHKVFGMFQPSIEINRSIFSPITSAPLAVSRKDIVRFEVIGDSAFPEIECYTKNEVEALYERYATEDEDGFCILVIRKLTDVFWSKKHPIRSVFWAVTFFLGSLVVACVCKKIYGWLICWAKSLIIKWIGNQMRRFENRGFPKDGKSVAADTCKGGLTDNDVTAR